MNKLLANPLVKGILGAGAIAAAFSLGLALPAAAQSPIDSVTAPIPSGQSAAKAVEKLPLVDRLAPLPPAIGTIQDLELAQTVPPEDLEALRDDLRTLANLLHDLAPSIDDQTFQEPFDAARVDAMTEDELTYIYNALPDVAEFHIMVTSLVELLQHPVSRQRQLQFDDEPVAPKRSVLPKMDPGAMLIQSYLPYSDTLSSGIVDRGSNPIAGCPETRNDDAVLFGLNTTNNVLITAYNALDSACQVDIDIPCPIGTGGKFGPLCIAAGIAGTAQLVFAFTIDQMNVCDTNFTNRTVQASWQNSKSIHDNLDQHHMNVMDILTEFRQLAIRTGVEENLMASGDLRMSMFQLPQGPFAGVSIQRTREIVLDTIQRNQLAGMAIGNAQAEFDAGEALLAQNKYKDAYARYRNAYRAAVAQTIR